MAQNTTPTDKTKELLSEKPPKEFIGTNPDGSLYININPLEDLLDELTNWNWSTRNFYWQRWNNMLTGEEECAGSLELVVGERSFIGSASFKMSYLEGNKDWCASLKSFCVKNAASDWGVRTGRWLNEDPPHPNHMEDKIKFKKPVKVKPDQKTRKIYGQALMDNDTETIKKMEEVYDFNNNTINAS